MDSSISLFHIVSVIASFLSVSLGCFLILIKSKPNRANVFLGLLLLTYSLFFLPGFLDSVGLLDEFPHIIRLNFFAGTLVGPFTYLYCKASVHKESLKIKSHSIHLIPFLFSFIWFWPTLIKSGTEKLEIYYTTISEGSVPEHRLILILLSTLTLLYTITSIRMILKYLRHVKNMSSNFDPSFHRWLLFLSFTLLAPIIVVLIVILTKTTIFSILTSILTLASFIVIIYITLTLRPKFFHHIPNQIKIAKKRSKYQNSALQENQKSMYQEKILSFMNQQKPYLNPELTINLFSKQLDISSHYVSQIINENIGMTFLDFVNNYRIEEVKNKLANGKMNHFTIMTLAYDSGFNSKTAFYSTFRKNMNQTPSQFRANCQNIGH